MRFHRDLEWEGFRSATIESVAMRSARTDSRSVP